jgi:hypothetical protein
LRWHRTRTQPQLRRVLALAPVPPLRGRSKPKFAGPFVEHQSIYRSSWSGDSCAWNECRRRSDHRDQTPSPGLTAGSSRLCLPLRAKRACTSPGRTQVRGDVHVHRPERQLPPASHLDSRLLRAVGTVTKPGKPVACAAAEIRDGRDKVVATASSSLLIIPSPVTPD